jgi:hypothetical protein
MGEFRVGAILPPDFHHLSNAEIPLLGHFFDRSVHGVPLSNGKIYGFANARFTEVVGGSPSLEYSNLILRLII